MLLRRFLVRLLLGCESDTDESRLVPFSGVCFEKFYGGDFFLAFACQTEEVPWIRKCCPVRHVFNTSSNRCQSIVDHPTVPDWRPHGRSKLGKHYIHNNKRPNCSGFGILNSIDQAKRCKGFATSDTTFLPTGELKPIGLIDEPIEEFLEIVKNITYNTMEYCGEKTWHEGNLLLDNIVVCTVQPTGGAKDTIYGAFFILGGFCLLMTVSISLWLPELRLRLHNLIALTHNATLMVAYFIWGSVKLSPPLKPHQCTILILLIQFSFLGSLFWLNAMCLDMSSTFRTTRLVARGSWKRYLIYSAYAWGLTSMISVVTVTMEFADHPPFGLPRPGFSCYCDFARETISILLYFYGPMAILLVFNLVLYVFTAWKIMSVQKQTAILHKTDSNTTHGSSFQSDRQRLIVYTKLFLLMGITWMTEIIGWAVNGQGGFWVFLDVINLLRAVLIFVLFVCKPPVLRSIKVRFTIMTGRLYRTASNTTDVMSISTSAASRKVSQETRDVELKEWRERKISTLKTLLDDPNEEGSS